MKLNEIKKKRRPGFTLVEMVVVVTILGILAGLGFMKFDQVQVKARENADYITATNLATAANLYINDNPTATNITTTILKNGGYITAIPDPQSKSDEDGFVIEKTINGISVKVGTQIFYPKNEIASSNPEGEGGQQ